VTYDVGDVARLSVTFTSLAGVLADPTVVTLTVQAPDNAQTTPAVTHDSTGKYHYDLSITQSGVYLYRYVGTGAVAAVEEGQITVRSTTLVPQPVPVPPVSPGFTADDLNAINRAIVSGALEVRFQDRTITYRSMKDLLAARTIILASFNAPTIRQVRVETLKGV